MNTTPGVQCLSNVPSVLMFRSNISISILLLQIVWICRVWVGNPTFYIDFNITQGDKANTEGHFDPGALPRAPDTRLLKVIKNCFSALILRQCTSHSTHTLKEKIVSIDLREEAFNHPESLETKAHCG